MKNYLKGKIKQGVGKVKSVVKNKATQVVEDLTGISAERNALKSDAFKRFKEYHPDKAMRYEQNLSKRIKR